MANRKPTDRHRLQGTLRADRTPKAAGARLTEAPPPPRSMSRDARRHWRKLADVLVARRVLTLGDLIALEVLAQTLGDIDHARRVIAAEGATVPAGSGGKKTHPLVASIDRARASAVTQLTSFGLNPAARGRVEPAPLVAASPDAEAMPSLAEYLASRPRAFPQ